jgi:hypothetical protein
MENWKRMSPLPCGFWPHLDEQFGSEKIQRMIAEVEAYDIFYDNVVDYFPNTCHSLSFEFRRQLDGLMQVRLSIPASALDEVEGSRAMAAKWNWRDIKSFHKGLPRPGDMSDEELRMQEEYNHLRNTPSIWPQNRERFLKVVSELRKALPVREAEFDPRLIDDAV